MNKIILFVIVLCFKHNLIAQKQGQVKIDSLLILLKTDRMDTSMVNHLNELAWEIRSIDVDTAIVLNNEALKIANELVREKTNLVLRLTAQKSISKAYYQLGFFYYMKGEFDLSAQFNTKALNMCDLLLDILSRKEIQLGKLQDLMKREVLINKSLTNGNTGILFHVKGDYPKALEFYFKAMEILVNVKDTSKTAVVMNRIGSVYFQMGNFGQALEFYFKALKYDEKSGDKEKISGDLSNIGIVYDEQGKYPQALDYFLKALKMAEEVQNKNIISTILGNIGNIYNLQNSHDKAIDYYNQSLKIAEASANKPLMAANLTNIGVSYYEKGEKANALNYFFKSSEIANEIGLSSQMVTNYNNIGSIYAEEGDTIQGLKYFFISLNKANEIGDSFQMAFGLGNIGSLYTSLKKYSLAKKYLLQSVLICDSIGALNQKMDTEKGLSELFTQTGDYKLALEHFKKAMIAKDSLFNEEKDKEITQNAMTYEFEKKETVTRLETEKKEQQIILLKKENQLKSIIAKKENQQKSLAVTGMVVLLIVGGYTYALYSNRKKLSIQLESSLHTLKSTQSQLIQIEKEKEAENIRLRISRDIHDDIGHNLTKIALLSGISAHDKNIQNPETKETLNRIGDYSREVNSSLSEIVWAISPKQDNLESLMVYMRNHIHKFFENTGIKYTINFSKEFENRPLNPDLKRNIFLVLKESLNNILKYAVAANVYINFMIDKESFELIIKDDGKGFDFKNKAESGNGLSNMKYRIEQSKGSFFIDSKPGHGCSVKIKGQFE